MKLKLLILAFLFLVLATAFNMFWAAGVERNSASPSLWKYFAVHAREGILWIELADISGTWNPTPPYVRWSAHVWGQRITLDTVRKNPRTGGLAFQWTNDGRIIHRWIAIPLWIPIAVLAAMIYLGRRRGTRAMRRRRAGFPVTMQERQG
jgi:hypothetical protein